MATAVASNYLENKILDFALRNQAFTSPTTVYAALWTSFADDGDTVTEVATGSYARTAITFSAAAAGAITTSADCDFPAATADWGTITYVGIFDASTSGNLLFYAPLDTSTAVNNGSTFSIAAGDFDVSLVASSSEMSTYLSNALLDHILRNTAYTPVATVYAALLTAFTDDSTYTEATGGSYARTAATFGAASGGSVSNSSAVTFPTASASWGTITHVAVMDASSSGNLLWRGALDASKAVGINNIFRFASAGLVCTQT
jgi:hypothetical protein